MYPMTLKSILQFQCIWLYLEKTHHIDGPNLTPNIGFMFLIEILCVIFNFISFIHALHWLKISSNISSSKKKKFTTDFSVEGYQQFKLQKLDRVGLEETFV